MHFKVFKTLKAEVYLSHSENFSSSSYKTLIVCIWRSQSVFLRNIFAVSCANLPRNDQIYWSKRWNLFILLMVAARIITAVIFKIEVPVKIKDHHHKYQGLDPLIRSVSRVTAARANSSTVFQLFSCLVVRSSMISKGFCFVEFFASVETSSVCIHLSCLICL